MTAANYAASVTPARPLAGLGGRSITPSFRPSGGANRLWTSHQRRPRSATRGKAPHEAKSENERQRFPLTQCVKALLDMRHTDTASTVGLLTLNRSGSKAIHSEYIDQRHGGYYVSGTRISLDSVVYSFNEGHSPEAIHEDFPSLKRAQIYGAIDFHLNHQAEIDKYLEDTEREFASEGNGIPMAEENPAPRERLLRAKAKMAELRP